MNDAMVCPSLADDEAARRWTAGSLASAEATAFEAHLLGCVRCQAAVERAATLAAALREESAFPRGESGRGRWTLWLVPVAFAAVLSAIVVWPRDPFASLADTGPAPLFVPEPVRAGDDASGIIDLGMAAYQAGDHAAAARLLGDEVVEHPTSGLRFFLGVSRLLSGDASGAVAALRPVAVDTLSPYGPEAQLWLAKAWLRLGEADTAHIVLRGLAGRTDASTLSRHAAALADSIEEVRRR